MRKLIFIHGAGDDVERPDGIARFLKTRLGSAFDIAAPQMPDGGADVLGDRVEDALRETDADTILVGHSLGASMLLKVISERLPGLHARALVLIAPPFWGAKDWLYEDFYLPDGFAGTLTRIDNVVHIQGGADDSVDIGHQALYAKHLPGMRLITLDGAGHDIEGDGRSRLEDVILGF